MTLPLVVGFALLVWLLRGVVVHGWWLQLACFAVASYLMVELNNSHALLRIRSRMVSSVFIILSCMASSLFQYRDSTIMAMAMAAFLLILLHSYQNSQAAGTVYYAFVMYGVCTCAFAPMIYLLPVWWLLMATQLQAQNGRLILASLLGVTTPYWLSLPVLIIRRDFSPLRDHVQELVALMPLDEDYRAMTVNEVIVLVFTVLLLGVSIMNFWQKSFEDKIRIRLIYGLFTVMSVLVIVCLLLQPHTYQWLMPVIIVLSSPLIAHYFTLTEGKMTNIVFMVTAALAVLITIFNLWMPSLNF